MQNKRETFLRLIQIENRHRFFCKCRLVIILNVLQETAEKFCAYFKALGADYVFDLKLAEDLSLIEQTREFVEIQKSSREPNENRKSTQRKKTVLTSACPGRK